ncbi:MAG: mycothiol transferase [Labedaea sp.]
MTSAELLTEAFDRVRDTVHRVVDGLTAEQLAVRLGEEANSIAWLVWHLTRIQDDHIAEVAGLPQVWLEQGFVERFGLPLDPTATGYRHTSAEVAKVRVATGELLTAYHDAVCQQTVDYVGTLVDADLPRVVDRSWDPPVTLAVRLISVISDGLQHAGQAAFVRGLLR